MRPFVRAPLSCASAMNAPSPRPPSAHHTPPLPVPTFFPPTHHAHHANSYCYRCWKEQTYGTLPGCPAFCAKKSCASSINPHADNLATRPASNSTRADVDTYTMSVGDIRTLTFQFSSDGTKGGLYENCAVDVELGGGDYTRSLSVLVAQDEETHHVRGGSDVTRLKYPPVPRRGGAFMHSVRLPEDTPDDTQKLSVAYVFRNTVNYALVDAKSGLHEYTSTERAAYAKKTVRYRTGSRKPATEFWGDMYRVFHKRHAAYATVMAPRIREWLASSPAWKVSPGS